MSMEEYAYGVVEGYVTVGGSTHPVSSFQLNLTHNGIPSLRLTIDPVHTGVGNVVSSLTGDATPAVVSQFISKFEALQQLTEQKTGRETTFNFKMESKGGDIQELKLEDWLLVAVGYAGISASGSLQMNLDVQHPVRKLAEGNIHLMANHADQKWDTPVVANAANVLDGIILALTEYTTMTPVEGEPAFFAELQTRTTDLVTALTDHLEWEGTAFPEKPFTLLQPYVRQTLQAYVMNVQGRIPWTWLMGTVIDDWYLSTRCTYWKDTLTLTPYTPWEPPQIEITDADVSDFSIPAVDPRPIAGVINLSDGALLTGYTSLAWKSGMSKVLGDGQAWVEAQLPGTIDHLRLPEWVRQVVEMYNSGEAEYSAYTGQPEMDMPLNATESVGGLGPVNDDILAEIKTAMELFCKQTFCQGYRQMTQVALRCRLMLNATGGVDNHVAPGYVCEFKADPGAAAEAGLNSGGGGGTLLKFFVTQVMHSVDCINKTATTDVSGQYLRRPTGPAAVAIPGGVAPNYLYD